jgi:DNA replication protein DnaC
VLWHPRFEDFAPYYGFTPRACQPYRARTKGKVESGVKYVKRNALAGRRFPHWAALEAWLDEWAATVSDVRVHGTTHERPIDRFAQETLTPLGSQPPYHYDAPRRLVVAADALVAIAAGRYSVPVRFVGQPVDVRETATHYVIMTGDTCIAQHVKAGRHAVVMEPAHYQGLLRPGALPLVDRAPMGPRISGARCGRDPRPRHLRGAQYDRRCRMSTPLLDRLRSHCQRLRLHRLETELPAVLEQAAKRDMPYSDFLDELLALEIRSKAEKHLTMRVSMARFPFQKTLDAFDFKFQPSIDPKVIRELATGRYLETGDNVLLLGSPGVGKTHLAVALGVKACEHGVRVLFTTAAGLIATLGKALAEGRLDERLKLLAQPQLLIVDEIGYIPIDRHGANLFFQLVSRRYERGAIILTGNQSLGAWGRSLATP